VISEQIDRGERVIGLQAHLSLDTVGVGDSAHPRAAHRDAPAAERHLALLGAVPVGGAVGVVATLRPGDVSDLGVDELAHHVQADRHRRRQQPVAHLRRERLQLLVHLPRQPLRQRRVGQIDHADLWQ
jgi:hypothetical protein